MLITPRPAVAPTRLELSPESLLEPHRLPASLDHLLRQLRQVGEGAVEDECGDGRISVAVKEGGGGTHRASPQGDGRDLPRLPEVLDDSLVVFERGTAHAPTKAKTTSVGETLTFRPQVTFRPLGLHVVPGK